jgi:exopolysaccharide biosynthesis WecB/TagA/CpsF family protein
MQQNVDVAGLPQREGTKASHGFRRIGPVDVLGVRQDEAVTMLRDAIEQRQPGIWAFANAHTVTLAERDPAFAAALGQATVFNDGAGVEMASKLLYGQSFPCNLNGTDLTPALLASLTRSTRIFLLGSKPGVAEIAAQSLTQRYPHVVIVGVADGFFGKHEEIGLTARISASSADLVLLGMGHPMQELFAARHATTLGMPLMCVGAFLDFAAGRVARAPRVVQRLRLEWVYRLAQEPRRLARRYLIGNFVFAGIILKQRRTRD